MALDYERIRKDKEEEYGTKVGNYGRLLANLYSDRAHFILELLQNAEDALKNRGAEWSGPRAVSFHLTKGMLRVSHFGRPFDEADVRGICEIGESVKVEDLTAIGRFGIGFKSVYAITERPEIHSGPEDFAIENFVLPEAVRYIDREHEETVFIFPLKSNGESAYGDIAEGLIRLGASSLLFLRQIEEVRWHIDDGRNGHYLRESKPVDEDVRRVTVIGQVSGEIEVNTEWLIFSRQVTDDKGSPAGHVEIAFFIDPQHQRIQPVRDSRLVVFFPTALEAHLGFLVQGPYQTTPSRDNVPPRAPWNKHLIHETAILLPEALRWLRDRGDLTIDVLQCLPLNPQRFTPRTDPSLHFLHSAGIPATRNGNMFAPLFNVTKEVLSSEPLLPRLGGGYTPAKNALLGRTEAIRQLFSVEQLRILYDNDHDMAWLSGDITQDRTPYLRDYLIGELDVAEVDPESIIRRLNRTFLEGQSDDWVLNLYEFLNGQPAIVRMLTGQTHRFYAVAVPLIRLEDGSHILPSVNGQPRAYLPTEDKTDFPTVHPTVCTSSEALAFLRALGLREPDLVDDVIQHLLTKYQEKEIRVADAEYEADMARILRAFATDSTSQKQKLIEELQRSMFVRAIDAGTNKKWWVTPAGAYRTNSGLQELFSNIEGVRMVDNSYESIRSRRFQELLEECGTTHHLKPVTYRPNFNWLQLRDMRRAAGNEDSTRDIELQDWTVKDLDKLLAALPELDEGVRSRRAELLWEALMELESQCGTGAFSGKYTWQYHRYKSTTFSAAFVRTLNETKWVPNKDGELELTRLVPFESLGWRESSFLQSKIRFEVPVVQELAREAGIEPEAIDLLKKHKITPEKLREWIGERKEDKSEPMKDAPKSTVEGEKSFEEKLSEVQTPVPSNAPPNFVDFPERGPATRKSAKEDLDRATKLGQMEPHVPRVVKQSELGPEGKALAEEFKDMIHGEYGRRCQICSKTFWMPSHEPQTFVVHVVPPSKDHRANYFGDLIGLCGWHYALVRYGEWTFVDPETHDPERMKNILPKVLKEFDDETGSPYFAVPIRFWNVYQGGWSADPGPVEETVCYSEPHWDYLCELLRE